MSAKRMLVPALLVIALIAPGTVAEAQSGSLARLDPRTRSTVQSVIDSVVDAGMPRDLVGELVSTAQRGAAQGASSSAIIARVRDHARRLEAARTVLGDLSLPDVEAGAAALLQGVKLATLAEMRHAWPKASVAAPLIVLSDLIQNKVPVDTASALILSVVRSRPDYQAWAELRNAVAKDIQSGKTPVYAAETGTRGVIAAGVGAAAAADAAGAPSTLSGNGSGRPRGGSPPPRP